MVATVVYWELLFAGRRRRQHVLRWLYLGWLGFLLLADAPIQQGLHPPDLLLAYRFTETLLLVQFILIVVMTPALTAAAITDEKARGTLPQLVTTDLWPGDILLGKLLARLAEMGLLLLTGWPVLALLGVFAGLYPALMLMVLWLGIPLLFGLGTAGLLASVLARTTRDAVVGVYLAGIAGGLLVWLLFPAVARALSPLDVLKPALERGQVGQSAGRLLIYTLAWLALGGLFLGMALLRFPRVWQRPFESRNRAARPGLPLSVGEAPIPWKEHRIHGLTPIPGIGRGVGLLLVVLMGVAAAGIILARAQPIGKAARRVEIFFPVDAHKAEDGFLLLATAGLLGASLVVGARASSTVTGEREAGTWDTLLASPLEAHHLLRGKLKGILQAAIPYLAAFGLPILILSLLGGGLAFFWTLLMLALTPLAMYYLGAAGIYCSITCPNSTRSLLWTLGYGYVGASVIYILSSFLTAVLTGIVHMFIVGLKNYEIHLSLALAGKRGELGASILIGSCLAMALAFFLAAHALLKRAEYRLIDRERIRQDDPTRRPRRHVMN